MVKHECKVTSFPGLFPFAINCSLQILRHESSEPGVTCISVKLKLTYRVLLKEAVEQVGSQEKDVRELLDSLRESGQ